MDECKPLAGGAPLSEVATVEIESGSAMLAEVGGGGSKQAGPGRYYTPSLVLHSQP